MPTYIKTGFWEKSNKGFDHWLDLDKLIKSIGGGGVGSLTEAPVDGNQYARKNAAWTLVAGSQNLDQVLTNGNTSVLDMNLQNNKGLYTYKLGDNVNYSSALFTGSNGGELRLYNTATTVYKPNLIRPNSSQVLAGVFELPLPTGLPQVLATKDDIALAITKTKVEIDALITAGLITSANGLIPGALYKITGVHTALYNDGTNSGTTVYLKALSATELSTTGEGVFWNPKYVRADASLGCWRAANSYPLNSTTIWGGYLWKNSTSAVGTSTNYKTLSANWIKQPYNATDYNKSVCIIGYDYSSDTIIRRNETTTGNNVLFNADGVSAYAAQSITINGINAFRFGLPWSASDGLGVVNNELNNAGIDCINFGQTKIYGNKFNYTSSIYANNDADTVVITDNIFHQLARVYRNTIPSITIEGSTLYQGSIIFNNNSTSLSIKTSLLGNGTLIRNNAHSVALDTVTTGVGSLIEGCNTSGKVVTLSRVLAYGPVNIRNFTNSIGIADCNIKSSTFDALASVGLADKTIQYINFTGAALNMNLAAATLLFSSTMQADVYVRPDGTIRLRYYNDSDVMVIASITT